MRRNPPTPNGSADWDDAKVAMQEFGSWIKNADTKITILAAVLGVSLTALAGRAESIVAAVRDHDGRLVGVLIVSLAIVGAAAIVTAHYIIKALRPRVGSVSNNNRFSWPAMAKRSEVPTQFDADTRVAEAWEQAGALAKIAQAKYESFTRALRSFIVLAVAACVAISVASWVGHTMA